MKLRIFKKDDSILINYPHDCKIPKKYEDLDFIILDKEELPKIDSKNGFYQEMIYFDGECKKENLKHDKEWNFCLMPYWLILKKQKDKINNLIDKEFEKENPDPIFLAKKNRDIQVLKDILKNKNYKFSYELALNNLDERVSAGESDKPIIREKLKAKIKELSE